MKISKRILAVFFALVFAASSLSAVTLCAAAKTDRREGFVKISCADDLLKMRDSDESFRLTKDIDLGAYGEWNEKIFFKGTLDGNGYRIKNLSGGGYGLFYSLSGAVVKNLGLVNVRIKSDRSEVGALTAKCRGTTIENCYVTGSVENVRGANGIASGLVGHGYGRGGNTLKNCVNMADIVGYEACGLCCSDKTDIFENCVNYGRVTGVKYAGGICCALGTEMRFCYGIGSVSASDEKGCSGGLAGKVDGGSMLNCATVSQTDAGRAQPDFTARAATGVAKSEFKKAETYAGLDFGKTWTINSKINGGRPVLTTMLKDYNGSRPAADKPAGTYKGSVKVELTTGLENGVIRYTTDGKTPTASSPKYTKQLTVKKNTTVKAAVFVDGVRAKVAAFKYVIK